MIKMIYVEAPNEPLLEGEIAKYPRIFLAGGITGCLEWQSKVTDALREEKCVIFNPRRENFPINDPDASYMQIYWEKTWLDQADLVSFWFAEETIQPIVLFELGRFVDKEDIDICVGIHSNYPRKIDVEIQTTLARFGMKFAYSLEAHIEQIKEFITQYWKQPDEDD